MTEDLKEPGLRPLEVTQEGRDLINSVIVDAYIKAVRDYGDNQTSYRQDIRRGLSVIAPLIVKRANARLIAVAPDMAEAGQWVVTALKHIEALERELGEGLPDNHELGRIAENADLPSFRIQVGHIRLLAAAILKATSSSSDREAGAATP